SRWIYSTHSGRSYLRARRPGSTSRPCRSRSDDMKRPEGAARRITWVLRCAFCVLLTSSTSCGGSSGPAVRLDTTNPSRTFIEVTGLPRADLTALSQANLGADEWSALLHVTLRSSGSPTNAETPGM